MNFLLRTLMERGVMQHRCIAFATEGMIKTVAEKHSDRAIMHMGDATRPGPFWAVHLADVAALEAAGYRVVYRPTAGETS